MVTVGTAVLLFYLALQGMSQLLKQPLPQYKLSYTAMFSVVSCNVWLVTIKLMWVCQCSLALLQLVQSLAGILSL